MLTNLIMVGILLFLAGLLLAGAKFRPDGAHFFDRENSGAMRGFWCLIVVLVHVPAAYQNRLQDMLGSFAYVGVTFFFLTSAYGLRLAAEKRPESIRYFWRHRLPKLLVPCVLANAVRMAAYAAGGSRVSPWMLVRIGGWVRWLLVCYLIFWLCYRFLSEKYRDWAVCGLAAVFSLVVYGMKPDTTTWCPEVLGFAWGILLGRWKNRFTGWTDKGWLAKNAGLCLLAGILGVGYLMGKGIPFWGDYVLKIVLGVAILGFVLGLNTKISMGNRVSRLLGTISYEVFLLHDVSFFVLEKAFPGLNSGVFILMSLLVTAALSLAVQRISARILDILFKKQQILQR
ncbi:MAG: acyltransferase family protein [Candidatus Faecousia sp.]|nr:acyltransferase family protein [Candidatus Faecousia sp.]